MTRGQFKSKLWDGVKDVGELLLLMPIILLLGLAFVIGMIFLMAYAFVCSAIVLILTFRPTKTLMVQKISSNGSETRGPANTNGTKTTNTTSGNQTKPTENDLRS